VADGVPGLMMASLVLYKKVDACVTFDEGYRFKGLTRK
jgi:hypothetical protein